jgi:STIP1 family protein 1
MVNFFFFPFLLKAYDTVRFNNSTASKVESIWKSLARTKYFFWSHNKALQDKELEHVQKELEQAKDPLRHDAREIPHHFRCCITFDLLRDPVVAPSGVSFERNKILEYLKKSKEDPTTRQPLDESQLYPNNNLRDAVDAFLERNWWAYST